VKRDANFQLVNVAGPMRRTSSFLRRGCRTAGTRLWGTQLAGVTTAEPRTALLPPAKRDLQSALAGRCAGGRKSSF
jgi:hypothetical protein